MINSHALYQLSYDGSIKTNDSSQMLNEKLGVCTTETLVAHITHRSVELLCAENKYIEIGDITMKQDKRLLRDNL